MKIPSGMTRREALKWGVKLATIGVLIQSAKGASPALLSSALRRNAGPQLIAATGKSSPGASNVTSDAIDTTGANFIVIGMLFAGTGPGTISDSKGNTWTALTTFGTPRFSKPYYCYAPTVGTGHTFTGTAFAAGSIQVLAFSRITNSPFDSEGGAANTNTTAFQPGPITTTVAKTLVVAFMGREGTLSDLSINNGYTIGNSVAGVAATSYGSGSAYKNMTSVSTENPTFTITTADNIFGSMAAFKY